MTDSYGTSGYGTSGYGTPGYVSPGYVPYATPGYGTGALPAAPPGGPPAAPGARPVLVAAAAAGVLVLGAAVAATVAGLILAAQADDVGRELGTEIGTALGEAQLEQMDQMMDDFASMDPYASSGGYLPTGPVDQFPPVAPGELGPDPVLDGYAAECFAGDLQACDDLYFESPPLSAYEEYASTCGGRVKVYTVPFCTELD